MLVWRKDTARSASPLRAIFMSRTTMAWKSIDWGRERKFLRGLARAFAGAVIFSLPLMMTMEMWWLGFHGDRFRLAIFLLSSVPLLVGLSHYSGFEETFCWQEDVVDAFVAIAVGFASSGILLWLMGVLEPGMHPEETVGKIALQAVPSSIGALLSASQFGTKEEEEKEKQRFTTHAGELFLMAVGAIFLALSVAPTDEMALIAFLMTPWQTVLLALVSLVLMHAFVYAVEFSGTAEVPKSTSMWSLFFRFTVPGYAIALLVSAYVLWTFGRLDDTEHATVIATTIVLGFPAAVGASAARLII